VPKLVSRLAALALATVLAVGNVAVCAGWAATPEARLDCCTGSSECPMHAGGHDHGVMTQAEADSCCAASETDRSQSSPLALAALSVPPVMPWTVAVATEAARSSLLADPVAPPHLNQRARHLLLSVLLV
jgi:hypothetical protein